MKNGYFCEDGIKKWYKNGLLHRGYGPAMIYSNGDMVWYQNGKVHREDGPAIVYSNGSKFWYKNGKIHREDGPAIVCENGDRFWYKNEKLHRKDGPAVVYSNGVQKWYENGELVEAKVKEDIDLKQVKTLQKGVSKMNHNTLTFKMFKTHASMLVEMEQIIFFNDNSIKCWYKSGKLHRLHGLPAVITIDGTKEWWVDGNLHREIYPAIIKSDGTKFWYKEGMLHNEPGPAVIYRDGTRKWYVNDKLDRANDLPAIEEANGTKFWYQRAKLHREGGPAIIYPNGIQKWYENGELVEAKVKEDIDLKQVKTLSSFSAIGKALQERKVKRTNILEQFYEEVSKDPDHIKIYLQKYQERLT